MYISALRLVLRLPEGFSPRQKRRLMDAMARKLRRHFNVALAEVDRDDRPTGAVLAVSAVGRTRREAREVLDRVAAAVDAHPRAEVVGRELIDL